MQVTFVKVYRRWTGIRPESVDAYVRQTLVNSFRSHRRSQRHESVTADLPDSALASAGTDSGDRIDLTRALALLPPRQRAMIVLRYLEDMSVAEVADVLGIAEGTVLAWKLLLKRMSPSELDRILRDEDDEDER